MPAALPLPGAGAPRPLLACGAELKNTFCLAKGERAWVGHHIGDLENYETLRSFAEGIEHFGALFAVDPEVVAHDLHPEYLSTKYALERDGVELIGVQHHHAHLAACLAEHGETGTGARRDLRRHRLRARWHRVGRRVAARRLALVPPRRVAAPGRASRRRARDQAAVADGVRVAAAAGAGDGVPALPPSLRGRVAPAAWAQVHRLIVTGTAAPVTTSIGRLFDAVAALCGIRSEINYEGQAAIELEAACDPGERGSLPDRGDRRTDDRS